MNAYLLADLPVGYSAERVCEITFDDIAEFAEFSGDHSSIHVDDEYARGRGFEDRLVHGMLIGSLISGFVGMVLPGKHGLLQSISLQFRRPIYAPDQLTFQGTVSRVSKATKTLVIELKVFSKDGLISVSGQANSVLKQ